MRDLVRSVVPPGKGGLVVDVGCGTGGNIAALAGEYRCIGTDTSSEAIKFAQSRFPTVEFLRGVAPDCLGPLAGAASMFLLMDVLEHVEDDFSLFSRLLGASRPGAYFLITVPADPSLWSEHDVSFGHYRRYDRDRLEAVWSGLPVTVGVVSYFNSRLYPLIWAIRKLGRLRGRAAGAAGTDLDLPSPPINQLLARTFGGEATALRAQIAGGHAKRPRAGVSLIALLRREAGEITARLKPKQVPPDQHDPRRGEIV